MAANIDHDRPTEVCELCGGPVGPDDVVRTEVTVAALMCPTPMVFHRDCYAQANQVLTEDPDALCVTDPLFPETGRWIPRGRSDVGAQ